MGVDSIGNMKFGYSYDENGNQTQGEGYHWDPELNDWVVGGKSEYIYDVAGNQTQSMRYNWVLYSKSFSYYSSPTVGINQLANENADIILFPNPTNGMINISGFTNSTDINLFDIKGQFVKSYQQINNTIDISELQSGIYILNLISNDKTVVKKVVKQ